MSDQHQYMCVHARTLKAGEAGLSGSIAHAQLTPQYICYEQPTNEQLTMIRLKGTKQ